MILNDDQQLIKDTVGKFAAEVLAPGAAERDKSAAFPQAELKQMADMGLMGILVPEEFGGAGLDHVTLAAAVEEIASADGAISTIMAVQSLVCSTLVHFGSDALKTTYLPKLANGDYVGAFALSEPQAGSDAAALKTTARKDGDHYILNGTKQFITSGKNGQIAVVFAVTDAAEGKNGISAFLVPTDVEGYDASHTEDKMGQKCSDTAQVVLSDVKIPADHLIGTESEGYKIALANLEGGRISIAAQSVGMARAAVNEAVNYARERTTFGQPLAKHQALRFRLADMATQVDIARQSVLHAAALRDAGKPCVKEACQAKLFASEMAEKAASDALQIFGGYGYLKDFPIERIYRDARVCTIYEGTSDIQRMVIANEVIGQ